MNAFCVHGHFYQPPREDPITGVIPDEPGAAPYRNWNEKIQAECYRPNAELRNFEKISFNVGPTLFSWMADNDAATFNAILDQDRANVERFGVGNAMAQSYNHTILPLASHRDQVTQVRWGIADFSYRFGRRPKGMWLPETAANRSVLQVLAEQGIEFTILAPWQAGRSDMDPGRPYRVALDGGRSIVVFFYHQELSTRVSFDPSATSNADLFLRDFVAPKYANNAYLPAPGAEPRLVLVASDGELYGHHQKFRDQFLAHLLNGALRSVPLERTFPELWLQRFPATAWMEVRENTSWSCHHGVLRWAGDCGCTPGSTWKAHLRAAFNQLATRLDATYEHFLAPIFPDPWEVRNQFVDVLLQVRPAQDLFQSLARCALDEETIWRLHLLLNAQYQRQRMFTSCGWFFDELDRIEPRNNIAYAAQAVHLTWMATGVDHSAAARKDLATVRSTRTPLRADRVFTEYLRRARHSYE